MKKYYYLLGSSSIILGFGICLSFLTSCEGPEGLAGKDGIDANETCKKCHNPNVVDAKLVEFSFSKHEYGEAAFEEAGSTSCGACHTSEGFKYVCKNSIPATFTLNTTTNKYANDYAATSSTAFGLYSCFTCHSNLHTTYDSTDFYPLTNNAAVQMTMWAGSKSIDLTQDNGSANLCVKCHQPRPITTSTSLSNGNVIDYAALISSPTAIFYDSSATATTNKLAPSYRTGVHYGTVGAIFAGKGGIEFTGSAAYSNSPHTSVAACADCHMAAMSGRAGGHSFTVKGNFNGCNISGCHSASPITSTSTTKWTTPRNNTKTLLATLAGKLKQGGIEIANRNGNSEDNLWYGLTTNNYDGYFNIYDPSSNPDGPTYNTGGQFRNPSPGSSWTTAQKAINSSLPKLTLKNVQMGAFINFQLCLREYSLGIHNTAYSAALLQNSIDALTAAGF